MVRDKNSFDSAARRFYSVAGRPAACALLVLASACTADIQGVNATGGSTATGATGSGATGSGAGGNGATGSGTGAGGTAPGSGGSSQGGTATGSGGSTSGSGGSSGGGAPPVGGDLSTCSTPGPRLIRRLTSIQYRNTLVAAFGGDQSLPSADVLTDPTVMKFHVDADAAVIRDLDAGLLMNYAETVAAWVVQNKLSGLVSCTTNDATCRASLINAIGPTLFREPLSKDLAAQYDALGAAETTFADAATSIITTMLESPYLLYRRELGPTDGSNPAIFTLTAYEVASELSYFMTDSAPDATLFAAAQDGSLLKPGGIDTQANRLAFSSGMLTSGMKATVSRFAASWFELDGLATKAKDLTVYPAITDAMRASMLGETQEFFADKFLNNGTATDLLTATTTFVDQELGSLYGVSGAPMTGFGQVDISGTTRAPGMLGQAAFLTQHAQPENSSPVQRGRFVRDRLLCEPIPAMPSNLNTNLASGASFTTNRERYEAHDKDPNCARCHVLFDPVGFTFENFDGSGMYRATENMVNIDASGYITPSSDDTTDKTPLNGAQSLIDYLASNDQYRACVVRYWSYYAHGRDNWTDKKCNDDAIRREAGTNNYELFSIFKAILHAQNFTTRVKDQ